MLLPESLITIAFSITSPEHYNIARPPVYKIYYLSVVKYCFPLDNHAHSVFKQEFSGKMKTALADFAAAVFDSVSLPYKFEGRETDPGLPRRGGYSEVESALGEQYAPDNNSRVRTGHNNSLHTNAEIPIQITIRTGRTAIKKKA